MTLLFFKVELKIIQVTAVLFGCIHSIVNNVTSQGDLRFAGEITSSQQEGICSQRN